MSAAAAHVNAVACALPERVETNEDLAREHPEWDMERVAERTGVRARRVVADGETALGLSLRACEALADASGVDLTTVDAIVYCTQSPDYAIPGNSHLLHARLGLRDEVLAFDYVLACSGFVYGLAIADSFVRSGLASEVLLVTADTYSRRIAPDDRATRALFGDGAAATLVSGRAVAGSGRIVGAELRTHGPAAEAFKAPLGGTVDMDGRAVSAFVNSAVPAHIAAFLAERSLTTDDVDLCVFHQASRMTLDSLARAIPLDRSKLYDYMAHVGNLVSASIPVALRAALDEGAIGPGDRVLLSGYGAGASYGSVLVEY
jgi:3-oxoacyl-[acyl-carrier-protein] synthase-3